MRLFLHEAAMLTVEQLLSRLNELRRDYKDDGEDDETYLAIHHAFLFISYNIDAFKKYVAEAAEREKRGKEKD